MSHQDGLGDDGPETTGLSKPDDGDDRMEKKSENVAHARDGIKLKNLKNSGRLRNSPWTGAQLKPSRPLLTFRSQIVTGVPPLTGTRLIASIAAEAPED